MGVRPQLPQVVGVRQLLFRSVGRPVDIDDLIDAGQVAALLGLSRRGAVSTYRSRYPEFPQPVRTSEGGRCLLWLRQDIEAWARATGRLG